MTEGASSRGAALREIASLFLKLGAIGFGGPAVHIAMMEEEVVVRRRWLTREHFLDLLGATNLIPGPNSTEMAIHLGYLRGGWMGLIVAGASFIVPAVLITAVVAWVYVHFGASPKAGPLLAGIKPVVVALILAAVWRLGKTAMRGRLTLLIGLLVLAATLGGVDEIVALFAGGLLGGALLFARRERPVGERPQADQPPASPAVFINVPAPGVGVSAAAVVAGAGVSLWKLGLCFLKIGSVLYGGGYVLVALLQSELVRGRGWLTEQQLLDAVAVGQFTPGPVLSTATFIGFLLAGWAGASVATIAIFLPSFLFVAALGPMLPRCRRWGIASAFLDAVNASSVALMAAVVVKMAPAAIPGWRALLVALAALLASLLTKANTAVLIVLGGIAGLLFLR